MTTRGLALVLGGALALGGCKRRGDHGQDEPAPSDLPAAGSAAGRDMAGQPGAPPAPIASLDQAAQSGALEGETIGGGGADDAIGGAAPSSGGSKGGRGGLLSALMRDDFARKLVRVLPTAITADAVAPIAVAAALGVLATAAGGTTERELLAALGVGGRADLAAELGPSLGRMPAGGGFKVASRVWVDGAMRLPAMDPTCKRLRGSIAGAPLRTDPAAASAQIDRWIAEQAGAPPGGFLSTAGAPADALVTSAVGLDVTWQYAFDPSVTQPTQFIGRRATAEVAMMRLVAPLRAATVDGVTVIELPLATADLVMWLVLPAAGVDPALLLGAGAVDALARWREALVDTAVTLALPRATIAHTLQLAGALRELGVRAAFDPATAELPGLGARAPGTQPRVDAVLHQTRVVWTERGAAAPPAPGGALPAVSATFDRPFGFLVGSPSQGTVLVHGRVLEPPTS